MTIPPEQPEWCERPESAELVPELTGSWSGVFFVPTSDGRGIQDDGATPFRLSWTQRDLQLFGYARPEQTSDTASDRGRVRGRIRRRRVAFVLALPMRYVVDAAGRPRPIAEVLGEGDYGLHKARGPLQLFFAGSMAPGRDDLVRGVFHVPPVRLEVDGEPVESELGRASGRFRIRRESQKASRV
ncbi:MAG: hypothetical protein AAF196_14130 [Planctomycetota bacterium]